MHTIMFKAMFLPLSYFDSYNNLLSSIANVGLLATPPESEWLVQRQYMVETRLPAKALIPNSELFPLHHTTSCIYKWKLPEMGLQI